MNEITVHDETRSPHPSDAGPREIDVPGRVPDTGSALAIIAPGTPERSVEVLVESLRARRLEASVFGVGPGVIIVSEMPAHDLADLVAEHKALARGVIADTPYLLVRREVAPNGTIARVGGVPFGGRDFQVIAGPCAVESRAQILDAAHAVAATGATCLRGGAFKPRSSPYSFRGLEIHGVELLAEARAATGLPFVTEIMDPGHIEPMSKLVDAFQIGARSMQNFELLRALADQDKPVVLKRGFGATVTEWLLAAEYLLAGGNDQVILCERGIRTFNTDARFTLDLAGAVMAKRATHLPVIVDPSHATGDPALVPPLALAALAAGMDGVMVEVHPRPSEALSDGKQALEPLELRDLMRRLAATAPAFDRTMSAVPAIAHGD